MTKIVLAGAAITARILLGYLKKDTSYQIAGCVVDDEYASHGGPEGLECIGISAIGSRFPAVDFKILMAMGYGKVNTTRASMFRRLKKLGYSFATWIHPAANVYVQAGEGCVIMPGALIEPGARVGADCFVWGNAVVAHDVTIEDHCWLAAGSVISGMAKVGERTFVGVNATVANKVEVGAGNIVGGAAFISKNTKDGTVHLARSAEPFRCTAEQYAAHFGL